jgi:hypothetical protein
MAIREKRLDLRENRSKHLRRKASGIGVVTTWVIAIHDHPITNRMHCAMSKSQLRLF